MNIEISTKIDQIEYDNFLKNNCESTFYHSFKHLEFLKDILKCEPNFITITENESLIGVLPFFEKNSEHGKVVNSLPFFGSYGGFVTDNQNLQKNLLTFLNNFNIENDVLSSVIISSPFTSYNEIYEKFFNYNLKEERRVQCIQLNKNEDELWRSFEQRVRRSVRKASKSSIEVEKLVPNDFEMNKFYQMHKAEMESKNGRIKPPEFFKHLRNSFQHDKEYDIFCAKKENEVIAFLLVFYFNSVTEYYMPAYNSDYKHLQATSLLLWNSIKTSLEKNLKFYNFGGTWKNQSELYLFKRGWAATDMPYNYYIYGDQERIKNVGINEIVKNYPNFYVFSYEKIQES